MKQGSVRERPLTLPSPPMGEGWRGGAEPYPELGEEDCPTLAALAHSTLFIVSPPPKFPTRRI
jgi:hypothetical protein